MTVEIHLLVQIHPPAAVRLMRDHHHVAMQLVFHIKILFVFMTVQCHGLWDNKEVEMPDFFKKMKRKVEKKRMTGDKTSSKEKPQRRLKFLPLQASTTSIFCRRKTGESAESDGEYSETAWYIYINRYFEPHPTQTFGWFYFSLLLFFALLCF